LNSKLATSSHFSNPSVDVCKELATNFPIHNAIKILSKLSVSERIAFSGVWKVLGLLLVLADMIGISEDFFSTKGGISLFAYNQGLREGIKEENCSGPH